jgi:methionyl-tRNA formyltransferase
MTARAVVFAYHNVGVRCLKVLLAHRIEIPLIVTHTDDPAEEIWFASVARTAGEYGIPAIAPDDANAPAVIERVTACRPDFLFSFYYRRMLKRPLLALPQRGALNVHGSLLPKYRGRAPVNWAILHGETETGATLHYMTEKPDDGDIVAQMRVPILPDDTAREVFDKVTIAAELTLDGVLPELIRGTAPRRPQNLIQGSYFSGRKPEDGVIDWSRSATEIHNLVRAVAPPYPGASTMLAGKPARILRTRVLDPACAARAPSLRVEGGCLVAHCGGGGTLAVLELELERARVDAENFVRATGSIALELPLADRSVP